MKNTIKIIAFLSIFGTFSCSKDDDTTPETVKEYYPTKIETTFPSLSTEILTTNVDYDTKNRISNLIYENSSLTYSFEMSYNSNNFIESISCINSDYPTQQETFNCIYNNDILNQIVYNNGTSSINYNFTYDDAENKYTLESSSAIPFFFKYDNNGNILQYYVGSGFYSFIYNNNNGIYNGVKNSLPMLFASLVFAGQESTLFHSNHFANKEMTSLNVSTVLYNISSTRNSNNNISQSSLVSDTTNETILSSTIDYELR